MLNTKQHVTDIAYLLKYYGHTFHMVSQPRPGRYEVSIRHKVDWTCIEEIGYIRSWDDEPSKIGIVIIIYMQHYYYPL